MKHTLFIFLYSFYTLGQGEFTVYFPTDKSYMLHSSKLELIKKINSKQILSVTGLKGFTDSTASDVYNNELAHKRVLDIQYFLIANGLTLAKGFNSVALGENFDQDPGLSKNRKVIIQYIESNQSSNTKNDLKKLKKGQSLVLKHLNFEPGLEEFRDIAIPVLNDLLNIMNERKDIHIEIHGHICCVYSDNTELSTRRALKVRDYLIQNGISLDRLSYEGHGSTHPIYPLPEINEEQMKVNRRVEIEITKIGE